MRSVAVCDKQKSLERPKPREALVDKVVFDLGPVVVVPNHTSYLHALVNLCELGPLGVWTWWTYTQ